MVTGPYTRKMADRITILSSLPTMAFDATTSYTTFLQEASNLPEHENGRRIILRFDGAYMNNVNISIWLFRVPDAASQSLESAAARCRAFCQSSGRRRTSSLVVPFYKRPNEQLESTHQFKNFLLVASRSLSSASDIEHADVGYVPRGEWRRRISTLLRSFSKQNSRKSPNGRSMYYSRGLVASAVSFHPEKTWPAIGILLMATLVLLIVLEGNRLLGNSIPGFSDDEAGSPVTEWHRYQTGTSIGPKNQLRIQWHNASEWGLLNPHQDGEWVIRMDDQALIPAQYMDNDERDRQNFFWNRYPHMAAVIEARDYIRPAWLGSKSVLVEWDHTFHDAHCVMALRRYFKAKETGRHVCPRDIDPGHILHCLNMLEKSIFTSGPMVPESPPEYMYWETKVCF